MFLVFGFPPLRQNIMTTSPNIAKPILSHTFTNGIRTRRFLNALEKMIGWVEYASDLTNPLLWPVVTMNSSHLKSATKHTAQHLSHQLYTTKTMITKNVKSVGLLRICRLTSHYFYFSKR